ncbi:hypothetical protein Cni_G28795 [Canna indica]|uniref:Uncharacterized protein n=1 Tax=Canna indica TaxID=4628 RepID=A0AAQ3QSU0_9LILI|nr:hypothetical protein Cni_G28795 [Canna indica]
MAFFPHQDKSKLHSKSLPQFIKTACAHCSHCSCLKTPSTLSSLDYDDHSCLDDTELDHKQLMILEIQSRAMKAKPKSKELSASGMLTWAVSPTTGRVRMTPMKKSSNNYGGGGDREEEVLCDGEDDMGSCEEFFSVKSCFSCTIEELKDLGGGGGRSIWEEFRHCEGWPFGLCRRAVVLPPLPRSPSESWMWHKRNLVCKTSPKVV